MKLDAYDVAPHHLLIDLGPGESRWLLTPRSVVGGAAHRYVSTSALVADAKARRADKHSSLANAARIASEVERRVWRLPGLADVEQETP